MVCKRLSDEIFMQSGDESNENVIDSFPTEV